MKKPETVGEVQRYLEAAQEHFNHAWGALRREGLDDGGGKSTPTSDEAMRKMQVGTAAYHLAAAEQYVVKSVWGMSDFAGHTDGQLCPYDDCAFDLAHRSGWWKCPQCNRPFYAVISDGDFEDYHNFKPGERTPEMPDLETITYARSQSARYGRTSTRNTFDGHHE